MAHILIVDDFVATGEAIKHLLARRGHKAAHVESGEAALAYCAGDDRPDLVILDEMMPGMGGLEVLQRLKSNPQTAGITVVLYTAVGSEQFAQQAIAGGAVDCWLKARMRPDVLCQRVQELLAP